MNGLNLIMNCTGEAPCYENFIAKPSSVKSNIVALALVKRNVLEDENVLPELLADGTTSADEVISIVRALQITGDAIYFPLGHLNGRKPKPEEIMDSVTYGLNPDPQPTGEVKNNIDFDFQYFYSTQNVKFFNWLRKNLTKYDLIYWTESTVHIVVNEQLTFFNIGSEITGNISESIKGGFSVKWLSDGEPVPFYGVTTSLLEGFTKLTFASPVIDALKLVKETCFSGCNVYKALTSGTLSTTIQMALVENATCVTWELHPDCSPNTVSVGDTAQINPVTGLITITAQPGATKKKYRVLAITNSCVVGEYCLEIVTK